MAWVKACFKCGYEKTQDNFMRGYRRDKRKFNQQCIACGLGKETAALLGLDTRNYNDRKKEEARNHA